MLFTYAPISKLSNNINTVCKEMKCKELSSKNQKNMPNQFIFHVHCNKSADTRPQGK